MHTMRDIGIAVAKPQREPAPGDRLNPFNGSLPVRGSVIVGTVVSAKMQATAVVEKQHERLNTKFERTEKRTRRYAAHVPSNIDVKVGDEVVIAECRPISKTVSFVVVENRGNAAEAHRRAAAVARAGSEPMKTAPVVKTAAGTAKAAKKAGRAAPEGGSAERAPARKPVEA
jgi:small subunit ribosomal protein S17